MSGALRDGGADVSWLGVEESSPELALQLRSEESGEGKAPTPKEQHGGAEQAGRTKRKLARGRVCQWLNSVPSNSHIRGISVIS